MGFDLSTTSLQEQLVKNYERRKAKRVAYVGRRDGTIDVSGRAYHIYARAGSLDGPEQVVYDAERRAPRIPGTPITLQEREGAPGRFEVAGTSGTASADIVAYHSGPRSMEYGGANPIIIDHRQIKQGLLRANNPPDMKIRVGEFTYYDGITPHTVDEQETAAISTPATGKARWDAVSINISTDAIQVTTGTVYDKTLPEAATKPNFPSNSLPMGYVNLTDQSTVLKTGANIKPVPPYFVSGTVNGGSGTDDSATFLAWRGCR